MNEILSFPCILPSQSDIARTFVFSATAEQVFQIADIDRAGRVDGGKLQGFQRPQIAGHIAEIRKYLERSDAILPNAVVVAFTSGVSFMNESDRTALVNIDLSRTNRGLLVDGQQRLTALSGAQRTEFEVVVSGMLCESEEELRKQFILINNTRPLPKSLIYELLPTVSGLPDRFGKRAVAAKLVEMLNFDESSSLRGQIYMHTNPSGVLRDTSIQRIIMQSLSDGAMRELAREDDSLRSCFRLISNFFGSVQDVFDEEWVGHTPKTSRLVHGAGLVAMGYVMEYLVGSIRAHDQDDFRSELLRLRGKTAWTEGAWIYSKTNIREWNSIQNVARDWLELSHHLVGHLKRDRALERQESVA